MLQPTDKIILLLSSSYSYLTLKDFIILLNFKLLWPFSDFLVPLKWDNQSLTILLLEQITEVLSHNHQGQ